MIACPSCKSPISERATSCPKCGWRRPIAVAPFVVFGIIAVFAVIMIYAKAKGYY